MPHTPYSPFIKSFISVPIPPHILPNPTTHHNSLPGHQSKLFLLSLASSLDLLLSSKYTLFFIQLLQLKTFFIIPYLIISYQQTEVDLINKMTVGDLTIVAGVEPKTVCVTGAGGYIASWLVKLLLEKGYTVKGTVRNPDDPKNDHLKALDGAKERLILCKADLLDYDALRLAIEGCQGVFHTASPVTDDPEQMVEPAVRGTGYVIDAAAEVGTVRRVVFTSSIGAVTMNPNRGPDVVVDESCWSDLEFCKKTKNWYCYGKAVAEQAAVEAAKERGVDLVVVNPVLVIGPLLQPTVNASIMHILKYLDGSAKKYTNAVQAYVDVRDVAQAHVRVFEAEEASGRYLCAERVLHREDVVRILAKFFPEYPVPTKCSDEVNPRKQPYQISNKRLRDLGLEFTPVSESLYETVKSLQEKGHLPILSPSNHFSANYMLC